eukprot:gnl/MRDRNA2_/MRDRNA2_73716_c0_seq2.p2 gnl/MRDRNA2_/MRDRNA2_73716_c0~~gnl/MRDRNA2_/MRDRNA2_73716_c0_seq2.p2  ORF type:complete len:110 (-),score=15.51 gnl/MRDRNA2_/MRDRNA2_73716_c0_seq2:86-415(-)
MPAAPKFRSCCACILKTQRCQSTLNYFQVSRAWHTRTSKRAGMIQLGVVAFVGRMKLGICPGGAEDVVTFLNSLVQDGKKSLDKAATRKIKAKILEMDVACGYQKDAPQ